MFSLSRCLASGKNGDKDFLPSDGDVDRSASPGVVTHQLLRVLVSCFFQADACKQMNMICYLHRNLMTPMHIVQ